MKKLPFHILIFLTSAMATSVTFACIKLSKLQDYHFGTIIFDGSDKKMTQGACVYRPSKEQRYYYITARGMIPPPVFI